MAGLFRESDGLQRIRDLPLHQRLLLCALYRASAKGKEVTFGVLSRAYEAVCRKLQLDFLRAGLFDLLSSLACSAFVVVHAGRGKKADTRDAKVELSIVRQDIAMAFEDSRLLTPLFKQQ